MKNSWLIAKREWLERMRSSSFIGMALFGPLLILALLYFLFAYGGEGKQRWKVLIADPTGIMANKIVANEDNAMRYSFADGYIELEEFRDAKQFQEFDALIEINEKVLSNKTAFIFHREQPSVRMQTRLQFQLERRLEEVMIQRFTDLKVSEFRKIKQPLTIGFRNVYDPFDESKDIRGWAGFFFGGIIFLFLFLFGMTILRSVTVDKSNRIVEVLLASVNPNQLLAGKIIGVGLAAFVQFFVWFILVSIGLFVFRESLFPDLLDPANMNFVQLSEEMKQQSADLMPKHEYNSIVELVFDRIDFVTMTTYFLVFFVVGYLFYGAFFAAIGATVGSDSDGQQFILPLLVILSFALYAGYYSLSNPESDLAAFFHYFPFTSPVVVMVKLAQGYPTGQAYQLFIALLILGISAICVLFVAGRLYKNGILQYGHRVKLSLLWKWLKKM
jgi:ABC-2 type transport system permease protein